MQSEYFIFDGIPSEDMGQFIIRMSSGGVRSPFFGGKNIQETAMRNKLTAYHFGTDTSPLEFTIELSPLEQEWTPQLKKALGKWLIHDEYKPFQTSDDLGKIYYAIVTAAPSFELYNGQGFIPFTFKTNSAYAWSPIYIEEFDLSSNSGTTEIILNNLSNINRPYYPTIEITLVGAATGVELKNVNNNNKSFKFTGLPPNSVVSVDNENEIVKGGIPTSNPLNPYNEMIPPPFAKFNRGWLELKYGANTIQVTGKCKIRTKMQFPILQ